MTKADLEDVEKDIEEYNNEQEKKAFDKFAKGPVPKMKWTMAHILERLLECIAVVKSGKAPEGLIGYYMCDELARILATKTYCEYSGYSLDEELAKETDYYGSSFQEVSNGCVFLSRTQEFGEWRKIVTALGEYLYAAAVLAKSVNAASTAARLYLRAWRIVKRIETRFGGYSHAEKDEALSIMRLEHVASERLWVDMQFATLPPFRKARKSSSGKAKGTRAK